MSVYIGEYYTGVSAQTMTTRKAKQQDPLTKCRQQAVMKQRQYLN